MQHSQHKLTFDKSSNYDGTQLKVFCYSECPHVYKWHLNTALKKARDPVSWEWQIRAAKWHSSQLITGSYFWLLLFSSFVWWSATFSCAKLPNFPFIWKSPMPISHNDESIRWNHPRWYVWCAVTLHQSSHASQTVDFLFFSSVVCTTFHLRLLVVNKEKCTRKSVSKIT